MAATKMLFAVLALSLVAATQGKAVSVTPLDVAAPVPVEGVGCAVCEEIIKVFGNWANSTGERVKLLADLDKLCTYLPSSVKDECDEVIGDFGPELLSYLFGLLQPQAVCDELDLCSMRAPTPLQPFFVNTLKVAQPDSDICDACKSVVGEIDKILQSPSDQKSITNQFEGIICAPLKAVGLEGPCDDFITDEGAQLMDWLAGKFQAQTVCSAIHAC